MVVVEIVVVAIFSFSNYPTCFDIGRPRQIQGTFIGKQEWTNNIDNTKMLYNTKMLDKNL